MYTPRHPIIRTAASYIPAPVQGWNPDAPPHLMSEQQSPILDNLIPGEGFVRMRSAFSQDSSLSSLVSGNPVAPIGHVAQATDSNRFWLILTRANRTAAQHVDPWNTIRTQVRTTTPLSTSAANVITRDPTGIEASTAATADQAPGPRWQSFGGTLYGISYSASTAPTTSTTTASNGYVMRNTNLLTLGPYSGSGAPVLPTAFPTTAPRGMFDIKVYLNRIWLLGGVDVPSGGTLHSPSKLFYTNPGVGGTLGTVAADWKNPVTAASNSFEMDQNYEDFGVGLAVWKQRLVVFRAHSVWVITGTTSTSFQSQRISADVGCVDARSIIETDNGIFFMSHRGLMFTDGVNVKNVSGPVQRTLMVALQLWLTQLSASVPGWCSVVKLTSGNLLVTLGLESIVLTFGSQQPGWSAVFNPTTGTWVRITSNLIAQIAEGSAGGDGVYYLGYLFQSISPQNWVLMVGDKSLYQIEGPQTDLVGGGQSFGNGLYDQGLGTLYAIPAQWHTRSLALLSNDRTVAQSLQYYLDYLWANDSALVKGTGWSVQMSRTDNTDADGTSQIEAAIGNFPQDVDFTYRAIPNVQRQYLDWNHEVTDEHIRVFWTDVPRTNLVLARYYDIYGVAIQVLPGGPQEPIP